SIFANWLETENMHLSSILEQIEMMITKYIDELELYLQQSTMKHSLYHLHFDKLLSELTYDVTSFVDEGQKISKDYSTQDRDHQVFEKIYDKYDTMNAIISFKRHKAWRKDVMKQMAVQEGSKALDVCCGTGDWSIALAEDVKRTGHVIGLDFSHNMLSVAKQKKQMLNLSQLKFIHGNAMDLPFADNSFDYVTIGFGLRNVPDYIAVLKEM